MSSDTACNRIEFEEEAARTDSVSNVPAFLTEHLRRRLLRKSDVDSVRRSVRKTSGSQSTEIGKQAAEADDDAEDFIAEPLTERGRETVLKTMAGYLSRGQREFVMSLRETYTADDWKWLEENLIAAQEKQ